MDETQPEGSATAAELKIDITLIAKLNLADFQNAIPLVRDLCLINETDQTHEQVELILNSDPPFLKPHRWRIDALAAGCRYPIRDLDLNLDGGLLARLTEAETATVSLPLRSMGADASTPALAQHDSHPELLPRNQWGGISHLPDLVAALVALAQRGWQVQPQIGASSFCVDLGIVDPDAPGRYLAGVECDGATYHRSATARDRDKIREQVLRGLGWEIVRVWSIDWWIDPAGTLDRLDARMQALLTVQRERRAEQAKREAEAERLAQAAIEQAMASATELDKGPTAPISATAPIAPKAPAKVRSQPAEEVFARQASAAPVNSDAAETAPSKESRYQVTNPAEAVAGADPDRFFDSNYTDILSAMIASCHRS